MSKNINFDKLFVFEMANNHMGEVEHGLRIIREIYDITKDYKLNFAFKLQYRDLDTFIHPKYKNRADIKLIKRFSETRLTEDEFLKLKTEMDKCGFVTICTPFDERSVDMVEKHNYDIIKIASCSFTDWPLLERIAKTKKSIIASTAGASLDAIDKVVSFLEHRNKRFCLMHCVGEYPTKKENLRLNQIDLLKNRYPGVSVGYSTHESPDDFDAIKIAIAKGASVFEKHVGIMTEKYALNAYSASPDQVRSWLSSANDAFTICGAGPEIRTESNEKEMEDLHALQRGCFAQNRISKGDLIKSSDVFFAIPNTNGQLIANDMSRYMEYTALDDIQPDEALLRTHISEKNLRDYVNRITPKIKALLAESKVAIPNKVNVELSHHYGIEKFEEWGATIITILNREYCKKLIILLPGQKHPSHYHKVKEEAFHVLYGKVNFLLNGEEKQCDVGDLLVVERNALHSFNSPTGAIFEEVSTTHVPGDSYYEDESIKKNMKRKTELTYWMDW